MNDAKTTAHTRTFLLVAIAGALTSWDIGFELGAFDNVSYRRVLAVFVISTVVLITTFVTTADDRITSPWSRVILALPLIYVIADVTFLTASKTLVDILALAVLITFPYTLYIIARLLELDFFSLPRREQLIAASVVLAIGVLGWYVGDGNDRFLVCDDFERAGDYVPATCKP